MDLTLARHSIAAAAAQQSAPPAARPAPFVARPCLLPTAAAAASPSPRCVAAAAGFGSSGSKAGKKKPRLSRFLADDDGGAGGPAAAADSDWIELPEVDPVATFVSKPIKPLILATGKAICLYKVGDRLFCTDANSTAYQYPLADANILGLKSGPAVESTLDGSVYDLATGRVITWCPKNTVVRGVLGTLKDRSEPVDLPVYPVRVEGTRVLVKLTK